METCLKGKSVKKWGHVKLKDCQLCKIDKGAEINQLLWAAVQEYAKSNHECFLDSRIILGEIKIEDNSEFPFGWGELQNQVIWFKSFYKALIKNRYKKLIIPEFAYKVKRKRNNGHYQNRGKRMDFLIHFMNADEKREETILMIEYKHRFYDSDKNQKKPQEYNCSNAWSDLRKASEKKENFKLYKAECKKIIKIVLMTIVVYSKYDKTGLKKDFDSLIFTLKPEANWGACWCLPTKLKPNKWGDGKEETWYYKGLYFLAKVE